MWDKVLWTCAEKKLALKEKLVLEAVNYKMRNGKKAIRGKLNYTNDFPSSLQRLLSETRHHILFSAVSPQREAVYEAAGTEAEPRRL